MFSDEIWLAAGLRTPFAAVDGAFAERNALELSAPVAAAMKAQARGSIDFGVWGSVALTLGFANLSRDVWLEAGLDPHAPSFTTIMQCSTSMVGVFEAAGMLRAGGPSLAMVGGVESMSRIQFGLGQALSVFLRRFARRGWRDRLELIRTLSPKDIRLHVPQVANRITGRSMGEHTEEMAKHWAIGRAEQDELALQSHRNAVAAQDAGFFDELIIPLDGVLKDAFPRRDSSLEKLSKLKPAFDRTSGRGTLTAGNSSPLTDGAAAIWVATREGLARLPDSVPRTKLVDYEMAAVDIFHEGLLMAPALAIPRLLARRGLRYEDIALWEIHEAFAAQVLCHIKALEDRAYLKEKAGIDTDLGRFPRERINPNGGSVALGHPFAATGARILSQAVKELAAMGPGARAIVSICADGGQGTVALLEN
jgi:acetyl-CoA C-acetyltransferase